MSDRLLRRSVTKAIISGKHPVYTKKLRALGYQTIPSEIVSCLIEYEQDHADMQCLIIEDTAFVLSCCQKLAQSLEDDYHIMLCGDHISGKYPENIPLNACVIGKTLIGMLSSLAPELIEFCHHREYRMVNVRQGYTKCSCAVISDNALITSDNGIFHSLKGTEIEVLKIEEGRVGLCKNVSGFIGGASGYCDHKVYFTGNIRLHPDYQRIKSFCEMHSAEIITLSDAPLWDIGGIVFC